MRKSFYVFILLTLLFSSCGKKDTVTKQDSKTPQQSSTNTPGEIKPNSSELEMSKGLPKDFPSDIPQVLNGEVKGYFKSSDGTIVNFSSDTPLKSLVAYYKKELDKNGYKIFDNGESVFEDKLFVSDFTKNGKKINITIIKTDNAQKSDLVITY